MQALADDVGGQVVGTYLHGPLLPRNPWLADWLLAGRRYDRDQVFGAPAVRVGPLVAWVAGFTAA